MDQGEEAEHQYQVVVTRRVETDAQGDLQHGEHQEEITFSETLGQHRHQHAGHGGGHAYGPHHREQPGVTHVVGEEEDVEPGRQVEEDIAEEGAQHISQRFVGPQDAEGVPDGDLVIRVGLDALLHLAGADHHQRQGDQHQAEGAFHVALGAAGRGKQLGELREDDGGTADADIDPQHGDGYGFGALLRLLAHDRRHGPERHIGEGVDHAPGDIGHRRIGHLGCHRQIQADEAEGGDARDQEGHAQHIGGKFAALEIQRIHIAGNEGIVDGIPNTGDEENGPGRSRRYSKNIGVKIENEGTHQAEAEALPDGVAEISRQLSILYLLVCHLPTSTT
ncbi:hypothetical protein D3C86_1296710 [compost metagenome]